MKRSTLGIGMVAAMLCAATSAFAGGVNLAWNNCASEGGVSNRTNACALNTGSNVLVGSFVPDADIVGVTGIEIVVDLIAGDGISLIPAWWDGTCRNAITMNGTANAANTICNDWAQGAAAGGLANYGTGNSPTIAPANEPAHRRAVGGLAVPASSAADLFTTAEYFAFNLVISNTKTTGTGACSGCATQVCIVLNSVHIVAGTTTEQLVGSCPTCTSSFATWQGTGGPSCQLVPTKNATWGQVKALYH